MSFPVSNPQTPSPMCMTRRPQKGRISRIGHYHNRLKSCAWKRNREESAYAFLVRLLSHCLPLAARPLPSSGLRRPPVGEGVLRSEDSSSSTAAVASALAFFAAASSSEPVLKTLAAPPRP